MQKSEGESHEADACIIGAGPVGMKLALDLAKRGMKVLLVDAGSRNPAPPPAYPGLAFDDPRRHATPDRAMRQGFGGTSAVWAGRCIPFDEIDFMDRDCVPTAKWPISSNAVAPWYQTACDFLGCGMPAFKADPVAKSDHIDWERIERWCAQPNMATVHANSGWNSKFITLLLNRSVTSFDVDPERGLVSAAVAASDGKYEKLKARTFIVAAGGIESTRLLLSVQRDFPNLFGGVEGPLGRHYMGHLSGTISRIILKHPSLDANFKFNPEPAGSFTRRYIALKQQTQIDSKLLNMAGRLELPQIYDASHGSGLLSLPYLALRTPWIGSKLASEPLRRLKLGPSDVPVLPHIRNVLRDPFSSVSFATKFVRDRYFRRGRLPGLFFLNPGRSYVFYYHAEHSPSRESRIAVKGAFARNELPQLQVNLQFSASDANSIVTTHDLIDRDLRSSNLGSLVYAAPSNERAAAVLDQAADGVHQIGTFRMGRTSKEGVVDGNCRVHGFRNLYAVGSGVFPTASHANPTLLAVALSARLADHLTGALTTVAD